MVKVLAIADEVDRGLSVRTLRDLAPDLVLAAGDLPWAHLEFVIDACDVPLVFVPGNHDPHLHDQTPFLVVPRRLAQVAERVVDLFTDDEHHGPAGAVNADGRVVEAAGLRIAGLGGCVRYRSGPNQYSQAEYRRRAAQLLRQSRRGGDIDVVLTHAPPAGCGDGSDRPHHGIEALHGVVDALQPTWLLHGHVHPHDGPRPDRQLGPTTVRNVIPWSLLDIEPRNATVTR